MDTIRNTPADELSGLHFNFDDPRLDEMLFRYRARNYLTTLSEEEHKRWNDYRHEKFNDPAISHRTLNQFYAEIDEIREAPDTIGSQLALLDELVRYVDSIKT